MNDTITMLLVHGGWHGPWCWEKLQASLARRGIQTRTAALPSVGEAAAGLGGLREDAEAVADAASRIGGAVMIVAHSYAGLVVTEAALGPAVRQLVFLGAFMPEAGRSLLSYLPGGAPPPFVAPREDGCSEFVLGLADECLYADCDPTDRAWAKSRLRLHSTRAIATPTSRCAWRDIPSSYIVLTEDRVLPTPAQRAFAAQASRIREMATSHSPMISRPEELADILLELAAAGRGASTGAVA
jgi:pimeloyl-ACP methyl ester carboxylesterase